MSNMLIKFAAWAGIIAALGSSVSSAEVSVSESSLRLASPTLEVNFPARHSLIQFFYVQQVDGEEPNIEVFLSHRLGGDVKTAHLETIQPQGRAAEIATVFTLDADGDQRSELFLVAKWPISHSAIRTEGAYYKVYVYKASGGGLEDAEFVRASDLEDMFGSGFDGIREGESVSFPYKDYHSIRAEVLP